MRQDDNQGHQSRESLKGVLRYVYLALLCTYPRDLITYARTLPYVRQIQL